MKQTTTHTAEEMAAMDAEEERQHAMESRNEDVNWEDCENDCPYDPYVDTSWED